MINDIVEAFQFFLKKMLEAENTVDTETIREAVSDICRLSQVGSFYVNVYERATLENTDKKQVFCFYSDGDYDKDDNIVIRKMTGAGGLLVFTVYHKTGTEPWSPRIRNRLDLLVSIIFLFNSHYALSRLVDKLAFSDEQGYHNFRYFSSQIVMLEKKQGLYGKAVVHFNLKHFSTVNNQIGRKNGDIIMRRFIDGLSDIVKSDIPICRLGGDNFIVLFDTDKIDEVVDYLSGTPISAGDEGSERFLISATAGAYIVEKDLVFESMSDIMDKIMPAVVLAKQNDKEDIVFFCKEILKEKTKTVSIQQLLPSAFDNEEFLVYYQPKVAVEDGSIVGAEALCRWQHDGKLISPVDFIPILEQSTDICKLDFYMLDHVCRDIRKWLDEGRKVVRISVNLSRRHMLDVDLLNHFMDIVDRNDVPHEYIEVELTETTTDVEFKDLKRIVGGLQALGVYASVDDFGIGYSSLNLIKEIPWNVVKIDRSILPVDEDDEHSPRSVMFKHVVAMAREMGLECIAEGVETEAQVQALKNSGCELAQGFFYDIPLPKTDFETRLK